jgi:hypothetical protein
MLGYLIETSFSLDLGLTIAILQWCHAEEEHTLALGLIFHYLLDKQSVSYVRHGLLIIFSSQGENLDVFFGQTDSNCLFRLLNFHLLLYFQG